MPVNGEGTRSMRTRLVLLLALALGAATASPAAAEATTPGAAPPGGPGQRATWAPADKDGFGTSRGTASRVWYTLGDGGLTEVYYPDLGTPSVRDLRFAVTDGHTFAERDDAATTRSRTEQADPRSLTYRQVDTERGGRWRI